ncbi:hypothetical protein [Citricoccus nitrophenolicus]|uniref:hypothetical protein n=1 Tax=Citricoccus nitrophenolicus TaxID=863575 RepID=UPI0031EA3FAF
MTEAARVLRPGGLFVGYDLLALRAAAWLHVLDRSVHRLIEPAAFEPAAFEPAAFEPAAFEPVLRHARLDPVRLRSSRGGRVLRFIAQKPGTVQAGPGIDRGAC